MHFRLALLIFSCVMIGFCLTVFFQNDQTVQTINWENSHRVSVGDQKSPTLEDFNKKITPFTLQNLIQEIHERNKLAGTRTRVMELDAGNGRTLMELQMVFPDVEFYGVNQEKTHAFYRRESYIVTALKQGIATKSELETMDLPYIVFQDLDNGTSLPYGENKFDLVYSHNTLRHIKYKFELLGEVLRVLKHDGLSFHTDMPNINIYEKGVILDFRDALAEMRRQGIHTELMENPRTLMIKKDTGAIRFPLTPHRPVPAIPENIPPELRRPDMGYNLNDH